MLDYTNLSDEQLVGLFQNGDENGLHEINDRYKNFINIQASRNNTRHPQIDIQDFTSQHFRALWKAAEKYDTSRSNGKPFSYWFKMRLDKSTYDLIRQRLYKDYKDKDGNRIRNEKKETPKLISFEEASTITCDNGHKENIGIEDKSASYEVQVEEAATDLYKFIQSKNETDAKIAILVVQGYEYKEIVQMLNLPNKMTVTRALERCRKYAAEYLETEKN
jgi:RNA polymerase sigma factor (sigma-70 family)